MALLHKSITSIPEGELVRELMSSHISRLDLVNIAGYPEDPLDFYSLPLTGLPGDPKGDIDLLLCDPRSPHQATAIQVKRFKVVLDDLREGVPNKLKEFAKGIKQANLLAEIGFFQVYLYVFVQVDARVPNSARGTFNGPSNRLSERLRDYFAPGDLLPRVGLIRYDFVQTLDQRPFRGAGTGSISLIRKSDPNFVQSQAVTEWVAHQLATRPADGPPAGLVIARA